MSQLYPITSKQEKLRGVTYIFNIIWSLDENIICKNAILEMILFKNLLNSFNSIGKVRLVEMLYFSENIVLMKHYVDLESIRT